MNCPDNSWLCQVDYWLGNATHETLGSPDGPLKPNMQSVQPGNWPRKTSKSQMWGVIGNDLAGSIRVSLQNRCAGTRATAAPSIDLWAHETTLTKKQKLHRAPFGQRQLVSCPSRRRHACGQGNRPKPTSSGSFAALFSKTVPHRRNWSGWFFCVQNVLYVIGCKRWCDRRIPCFRFCPQKIKKSG